MRYSFADVFAKKIIQVNLTEKKAKNISNTGNGNENYNF